MPKSVKGSAVSAIAMMVAATVATPVYAQSGAEEVAEESTDPLGDIVVTARRREESAQSVPLAISVQTGEMLEQRQVSDLFSLQQLSPSLKAQAQSSQVGATRFTVRGIGTSIVGPQVESSVGIVLDDVPLARPELGNLPFFDLQRIEVLRGPQGMLFGKNAAAGLINIVSNAPALGRSEFSASATYANMTEAPSSGHRARLDVAGNVPLGDTAALRLNAFVKRDDAFTVNVRGNSDGLGQTMYGVRGKLLFEPSDSLKIYLAGDYSKESGPAESVLIHRRAAPGGLFATQDALVGITSSPENVFHASDAPINAGFEVYGGSGKIDISIGEHTLTSITALRRFVFDESHDQDGTPVNIFNGVASDTDMKQFSSELRLASPSDGALKYQFGLFYMNYKGRQSINFLGGNFIAPFLLPFPLPPGVSLFGAKTDASLRNKSYAAYGEATYDLTDALSITAGLRYTRDEYQFANVLSNPSPVIIAIFGPPRTLTASQDKGNVSYRFIANYNLSSDVLVYGSYAKGYKGPTFDRNTAALVAPEIPKVWELGFKSTLFDRRLRLNLALFDETFDGFQTSTIDGTTLRTLNAGQLKARGVELEATVVPTDGLTLTAAVLYNDTKYKDLKVPCHPGQVPQPVGTVGRNVCTLTGGLSATGTPLSLTDVAGNQLAQAPKWTGTFVARYETPISSNWSGFIQGDIYFQSSYNFRTNNDPLTVLKSNQTVGASIGATRDDGGLGVTLFVRNLFDKRIPSALDINPASDLIGDSRRGGSYDHFLNADSFRSIGLTLSLKI
jgi:iron complex outermembrane recepter protein